MRYLLICHQYPPDTDASSNIVRYLAEELKRNGCIVDVIAQGDKTSTNMQNGVTIYRIKRSFWEVINKKWKDGKVILKFGLVLASYVRKLYCALRIKSYPNVEPNTTRKMISIFHTQLSNNIYDCVIGFFRPYFCLDAALQISKKFGIKYVPVYFDLIETKDCPGFMPVKLFKRKIIAGDTRIFKGAHKVFLPVSAQDSDYMVFLKNAEKIIYYNFPTFIYNEKKLCNIEINKDKDKIVFTFAGTLIKNFRNPLKLLTILNELAKRNPEKSIELNIYGAGDCRQLINGFKHHENMGIVQHGLVSREKADKALLEADCLVNISNEYSSIVPSKIFELFAIGKPIINILNRNDDGSKLFFDKYPLNYNIRFNNDEELRKCTDELIDFIRLNIGKTIDYESLKERYYECTPQYMTMQIIKVIEE